MEHSNTPFVFPPWGEKKSSKLLVDFSPLSGEMAALWRAKGVVTTDSNIFT
jgi:hypothetical protein